MFEYKVVPSPVKGLKAKGVKGAPGRFANALQTLMNDLATKGWEYVRADTLPMEERQGLTGKTTSFQSILVFRRAADLGQNTQVVTALIEDKSDPEPAHDQAEVPAAPDDRPKLATDASAAQADELAAQTRQATTEDGFVFPWTTKRQRKRSGTNASSETPSEA